MSRVMRCLHATTPEDLHEIGGWAHDAYFAWEEVRLDAVRRTVVVPFAQEPPDDIDAPRAELIREHRVGGSVFKVPFLRYRLVVREATGCEIAAEGREDPGMLLSLTFDADAGVVQVDAGMGPDVRIAVDEIDADIEVTDEIALYVRRAGGFERHWREGDADRPSEIDVLGLARRLVARLRR